jgi:2'-5' RNA ligase
VRIQARIELSADLRAGIDPLRERWNPERARGNPAHVTLVYHDEAPSRELLQGRLRAAASRRPPFELRVGPPRRFEPPVQGAFLEVTDPEAVVGRLRAEVLTAPFRPRRRFGLHVTLLHPDQGRRIEAAWPQLSRLPPPGAMRVREILLVGPANELLERIPLAASRGGGPRAETMRRRIHGAPRGEPA